MDPFFVCGVLPYRTLKRAFFVGAVEYFETPLMAWVARQVNCVPVDPDSNLVPAMKAGAFGLAHGKVLMLFPEGERSIDGTVRRFKKGAPILSRHLGVPVVPGRAEGRLRNLAARRSFNWRALLPWSRSTCGSSSADRCSSARAKPTPTPPNRLAGPWTGCRRLSEVYLFPNPSVFVSQAPMPSGTAGGDLCVGA